MESLKLKGLAITLLTAMIAVGASAQEATMTMREKNIYQERSGLTLIPVANIGVSETSQSVNPDPNNPYAPISKNNRTVYSGGMLVELGQGTFSLQTGLLYLQEGYGAFGKQYMGSGQYTTIEIDGRVDYVGIPLIGKLNMETDLGGRATLKAGMIPVYAVGYDFTVETAFTNPAGQRQAYSRDYQGRDGLRDVNVIGQVAAGYEIPFGSRFDLRLETSFNHSLMTVDSKGGGGKESFTSSLLMSLGMGIDI